MGRKRVQLTEQEIAERKARYFGPDRNARRRAKYATDPEYRERAIRQVRDSYRVEQAKEGKQPRMEDCRDNLSRIGRDFGDTRVIEFADGRKLSAWTVTVDELAEAMGRNTQVLYRWMVADLFPRPSLEARNDKNRLQPVYSAEQVKGLLEVFGDHQQRSQYLRSVHTDTVERLHEVATKALRIIEEQAKHVPAPDAGSPAADPPNSIAA